MKKWKNWKKNLVAAGILVTVCCGIYINCRYTGNSVQDLDQLLDSDKVMSDNLLDLGDGTQVNGGEDTITDYFAAVRLSRQQARDSAISLLQEAMSYGDETQMETTNAQLEQIIQTALTEAQIESLVIAKGYADCVAYMTETGISLAVASPEGGLKQEDVAVITDIVLSQCDYSLEDIRVVEVL
jgi:stage III sporulation protein AH